MPVGVPEQAVFDAADRVLARGERPTTERVRAELGRGSPARVGQLLEQWWDVLAKRLAGETRLPDLPPAVAEAFREVWATAAEHGHQIANATLTQACMELEEARAYLDNERMDWQRSLKGAQSAAETAILARDTADARLLDLQRLLEHQTAQLADSAVQRDRLVDRIAQLEHSIVVAEAALASQRDQAAQERDALQRHLRAVEDRAHVEIDRARQETKIQQTELFTSRREHAIAEKALRDKLKDSQAALAVAEREATVQGARAEALEEQMARLGDVPAAVQASLAQLQPIKRAARSMAPSKANSRKRSSTGK